MCESDDEYNLAKNEYELIFFCTRLALRPFKSLHAYF